MGWGKFVLEEAEHDLSHLDAFTFEVTPSGEGAPTLRVLVRVSHHAFTREREADKAAHDFGPDDDVRTFCLERLRLSLKLPALIRAAASGKAFFPSRNYPKQRNFLLVHLSPEEPPYLVPFNLERAKSVDADAVMFVVSAHPRPGLKPKGQMDSIKFATLVAKVVRNEPVVRPPMPKKK